MHRSEPVARALEMSVGNNDDDDDDDDDEEVPVPEQGDPEDEVSKI
jgi:hypothetical protein